MNERNLTSSKSLSTLALRKRRQNIVRQIPDLRQILRGSLMERYLTCGKPGCRCARGERHGPIWYLSVTLRAGKTMGMQVPEGKIEEIQRLLDNYRKLKESLETISEINWELLRRDR